MTQAPGSNVPLKRIRGAIFGIVLLSAQLAIFAPRLVQLGAGAFGACRVFVTQVVAALAPLAS